MVLHRHSHLSLIFLVLFIKPATCLLCFTVCCLSLLLRKNVQHFACMRDFSSQQLALVLSGDR